MSKVALTRCGDYGTQNVFDAVKRAVDLIGGIEAFVKPGMKVLIKPNLLSARPPEDAVDTHPEVVRAVARLVAAAGAKAVIGDSPGGYVKRLEDVFVRSGMRAMADEEGVELVRFTSSRFVDGIPVSRLVLDSDRIISVPKFKTHGVTILTAALKNTYGTVTGLHKTACHLKAPHAEDFAKVVAKIHSLVRPHLTVLDGITAMEGDGPSSGAPRKMSLVAASSDAVSMDACLAKIMGIEPLDVLVTKEASGMGLGEADLGRIEILGDPIDGFVAGDFKLPPTTLLKYIPKTIAHGVAMMIKFKPQIDVLLCTRCNLCKITCPVNCIEIEKNFCRIDYKRCVRCLCCHEVCPYKAIHIKHSILTKLIWR